MTDSPVFNCINCLSPIKPVMSIQLTQTCTRFFYSSKPELASEDSKKAGTSGGNNRKRKYLFYRVLIGYDLWIDLNGVQIMWCFRELSMMLSVGFSKGTNSKNFDTSKTRRITLVDLARLETNKQVTWYLVECGKGGKHVRKSILQLGLQIKRRWAWSMNQNFQNSVFSL